MSLLFKAKVFAVSEINHWEVSIVYPCCSIYYF